MKKTNYCYYSIGLTDYSVKKTNYCYCSIGLTDYSMKTNCCCCYYFDCSMKKTRRMRYY